MTVTGGLASFSFSMPSTTGVGELIAETAPEVLCHVGLVDIVRDAQGHIRKKVRVNRFEFGGWRTLMNTKPINEDSQ